jgi:hypothetical protein
MNDHHQCDSAGRAAPPFRPGWLLAGVVLFGIGFGFVEAVVVVDLRAILSSATGRTDLLSADEIFPMIPLDRLERADPAVARLMKIEVLREAATLMILAGVGLAAGRTFIQRFSIFLVAFGIWDLCYYLCLNLLLGWPASVWTWDILFLIPVAWAAPVLAPAIVAVSMVVAGSVVIVREASGRAFRVSGWEWTALIGGGFLLILSFCWDWRNIASGGMPNPFSWPLFAAGEGVGLGGFLHAVWANRAETRSMHERAGTSNGGIIAIAEAKRA